MCAMYVELESDPVVFEIQKAGGKREKDVILFVYGIQDVSGLRVEARPIPPAGPFELKAGQAALQAPSPQSDEPVRVAIPVTCSGGEDGKESATTLTVSLTAPNEDPTTCSIRLIAGANCVLPDWKVLAEEYCELREGWRDEIRTNRILGDPAEKDAAKLQEVIRIAHAHAREGDRLAALCFSGGGIRSATFNLGTLQGLTEVGMLDHLDYVSSVSGGGYLSGWLAGWLHRDGGREVVAPLLAGSPAASGDLDPEHPEAGPIRFLRQYSNYLTPKLGALSPDTWTAAATVIRNLLLNLLVLLPLLAAALTVPLLAVSKVPEAWNSSPKALYWLSVLFGAVALFFMSLLRASAMPQHKPGSAPAKVPWDQRFLLLGLTPLLIATALMAWSVQAGLGGGARLSFEEALPWCAVWGLAAPIAAFVTSILLQGKLLHRHLSFLEGDVISLFLSGSVVTVLYAQVVSRWAPMLLALRYPLYPMLAPILFLGPVLLGKTLFIAFSSFSEERGFPSALGDADREWWARWSGYVLMAALLWMVFSAIVFFGPSLLGLAHDKSVSRPGAAGTAGLLGWIASLLGKGDKAPAKEPSEASGGGWRKVALALAAPLFILSLLLLVAILAQDLLRTVFEQPVAEQGFVPPFQGTVWQLLAAIVALVTLGLVLGRFVNVNRFSLQAFYRNRLVRAYLGASNPQRCPNLFTGFDPNDNLRMHELCSNRPFPVVNMTLNLVAGKELAWQQRKAESFTATPLHCGAAELGYRRSPIYGGEQGISLGTAVATSGAAASPNMGFNSSPAITFIMTLFNVRLGIWLGNPGPQGVSSYTRGGPRSSALVLLSEALGQTNAEHPYVNLSDGGHFENLGIYEMVRRRCNYIVVCDAGGDPSYAFDDLGNAIRKIRIDFGIPIDFHDRIPIYPRPVDKPDPGARYCAIGTIHYSKVDGDDAPDGTLIYIKPAICQGSHETYDVYNYMKTSPTFPHETTADQWFSESQFESYRALGLGTIRSMTHPGPNPKPLSLDTFAANVREYLKVGDVRPGDGKP